MQAEGQAAAHDVGMTQQELSEHLLPVLPPVQVGTYAMLHWHGPCCDLYTANDVRTTAFPAG